MNSKKLLLITLVILLITLPALAFTSGVRSTRIIFGDTLTLPNGRAGAFVSNSQYTGVLSVKRIDQDNPPGEENPRFVERLVDIRMLDFNNVNVKHIVGPVYVYFNVRQKEAKSFENGDLTIYFFDTWTKTWTPCYTFPVNDYLHQTVSLACRMRVFGTYGLGEQ